MQAWCTLLEPVCCSMSSSKCCFLTCIQIFQETGQVVWYFHLFQNFPQFVVIHTVKGFGTVNKAEIDVFLELFCFFDNPTETTITESHKDRKLTNLITWTTALPNLMKLWALLCRATQDRRVMVESSDKLWFTGEGNGKSLEYSCLENPMNSMKTQKSRTLKDELPRLIGAQYATGDQWRSNSKKNEGKEP